MATQVVQAKCPGCQQVLRIPAAWLSQPFRCKHCGTVIKGKAKAQTPLPPTLPSAPFPEPAVAAQAPAEIPAFGDAPIITTPSRYRRRSHGLGWTMMMLAVVFMLPLLAIGSLAALLFFQPFAAPPDSPENPTASNPKGEDETGAHPRPGSGKSDYVPAGKDVFPRRALIVSVNNYLYANPITHGIPNSDVAGVARARNVSNLVGNLSRSLHIADNQIIELSDSATRNPHAPLKPVIEQTVSSFLSSSRPQDCILLFFIGHAVEIGDDAYLVPVEGELEVKETLIPLKWLYEQLSQCKARQKVLVLDICRFDPARGLERPDGGEMDEKLDAVLQKPPAGVQVWSACVAKQHSYELSESYQSEGIFLDELFLAMNPDNPAARRRVNLGLQKPQDPIPVERLAAAVNARTKQEAMTEHKAVQTPRLVGKDPEGGAYDPKEAMPEPVAIKALPEPPGGLAGKAVVQSILRETEVIPPVKVGGSPLEYETLPAFSAKTLGEYRPDYATLKELEAQVEKYPLRKATLDSIKMLKKHEKSFIEIYPGGGQANAQQKAKILQEQSEPAKIIAELQEQLEELQEAGKERDKEMSRRWQANYDYVLARLTARIAYVYEYNLMLGKIRKDDMPELDPKIHSGWRLASQEKLHLKEAKESAATSKAALEKLIKENPGTPWEVLAKRDRLTSLGLEWQPARYGGMGGSGE